ncbi:hypothetical protein J4E91_001988 [Alternaria rosae]|nr:hypothetical protein J4E91_001988 [Alternaria rosae]
MSTRKIARTKRPSKAAQDPIFAIVEAGDTKTRSHVHRWLLVQNSEYFKKALSGRWKETQDGVVTLEDVECSTCEWRTFWRTVRDSLIEHIVERGTYYGALIHAFAHLPKAHAILDLFVEVQCRGFDDSYDTAGNGEIELRASLPHDFLVRVMFRYSRSDEEELPLDDIDRCDYHGHADEEEKKQYQTEVNRN